MSQVNFFLVIILYYKIISYDVFIKVYIKIIIVINSKTLYDFVIDLFPLSRSIFETGTLS